MAQAGLLQHKDVHQGISPPIKMIAANQAAAQQGADDFLLQSLKGAAKVLTFVLSL